MTTQPWGRVDPDGTVWLRTTDGERRVGQYPGASPEDALAYYVRKFEDLQAQVSLLEQRIAAGHVTGQDAVGAAQRLAGAITDANVIGDLQALLDRLTALTPLAEAQRAAADAAKSAAKDAARAVREALVSEAEKIVEADAERITWKSAGDRLRVLFDEWKVQQRDHRLDKAVEEELWKRFSHARATFDRKRRQHFGALDDARSTAKSAKEALIARAEALAASTEWAATAVTFRDLMNEWKTAGRASKNEDDALWARFKAAQDVFFGARNADSDQAESEFRTNLTAKEALLLEAEALLPVTDLAAARAALRSIQERWDGVGKVPRADMSRIEARLRAVEQSVRENEERRWHRSNPEALARAEAVVAQLEAALVSLEKELVAARAAGKTKAVAEAEAAIAARTEWLAEARKTRDEFGG